eukprot:6182194-Heterocapsa_arctica.AAC.1
MRDARLRDGRRQSLQRGLRRQGKLRSLPEIEDISVRASPVLGPSFEQLKGHHRRIQFRNNKSVLRIDVPLLFHPTFVTHARLRQ